jgi:hypothetical protein
MHRKARKTTLSLNELIRWCFGVKGVYWYVAPFYNQAKKIVWQDPEMLPKYVPPTIWDKRNNSELTVTFPNGSILYVLGADKPDSLRGPNPKGVILDEYGDMKSEIWSAIIQPIMTANQDAWTWFVGTPKGKNDFWAKYNYGLGDNKNWFSTILKSSQSGILSQEALEEAKKTTTEAFYNQEYECEFLEGAGQYFRRIRENLWDGDVPNDHDVQLGVDLAKYQDWTVIAPFSLNEFKVGKLTRFNQVDWNLQKARIEAEYRKYRSCRLNIDSTGVGDPIAEDLERAELFINPFKFTETSRRQLLDNLAIKLEKDDIKIPNDEGLIAELEAMRFTLTERGKIKVEAIEGMTDDRVMAVALSVWDAIQPIQKTADNLTLYTQYG